jgi:hypothetical protein
LSKVFVQRCPCVARIATARMDARRLQREADRMREARNGSHDDITPDVLTERADAARVRAITLALTRRACLLCSDTGFVTGNGSASRGGPGSAHNPSDQLGSVRIA